MSCSAREAEWHGLEIRWSVRARGFESLLQRSSNKITVGDFQQNWIFRLLFFRLFVHMGIYLDDFNSIAVGGF